MESHKTFSSGLSEDQFDQKYPDASEQYGTYERYGHDLLADQITPEEVERGMITREKVIDIIRSDLGRIVMERAMAEYLQSSGQLSDQMRIDMRRFDPKSGAEIARELVLDAEANPDVTYSSVQKYAKDAMKIYGGKIIAEAEKENSQH